MNAARDLLQVTLLIDLKAHPEGLLPTYRAMHRRHRAPSFEGLRLIAEHEPRNCAAHLNCAAWMQEIAKATLAPGGD